MSPGSRWNFEVLLGRCSWIESGPHHRDLRKVGNWQTCGWLHRWLGGSRFFEFWILFSNRREMWMETPKEVVHSLPLGRWVPDSARCDSAKIACRYLKTALHLGDRRHTEKAIDVGPSTLFRTNIWFGKTHWNCLKSMMFFLMFFCFPLAHCSESIFEKDRWKRMPWWRLFFFFFFFPVNIWLNSIPKMKCPLHNVEITTDPYKDSVPRYWCFHWFSWQLCALCTSWASSEVDEASSLKERHNKTIKRIPRGMWIWWKFRAWLPETAMLIWCNNIIFVLYTV